MPYITTADFDEIQNELASAVPGFSGEVTVTVEFLKDGSFVLTDVEIVVWRHGAFRTQVASDPLTSAIRAEIEANPERMDTIARLVNSELAERRYMARDRRFSGRF